MYLCFCNLLTYQEGGGVGVFLTHNLCTLMYFRTHNLCTLMYFLTRNLCTLMYFLTLNLSTIMYFLTHNLCTLMYFLTHNLCTLMYLLRGGVYLVSLYMSQSSRRGSPQSLRKKENLQVAVSRIILQIATQLRIIKDFIQLKGTVKQGQKS